ncbi:hypothetical protein MTO96_000164 [Rhipicephalus appendiculatus]
MESANAVGNECVEAVEEVEEADSKEPVQATIVELQTNALEQTPTVSAESYGLEREDPATPGNIDASGYPSAGELFPTGDDEPDEEPEDSPANDGLLESTSASERLSSRVHGMD